MDHAGAILAWLYGNVMGQLDTGRICADPVGEKPLSPRRSSMSNPVPPPETGPARSVFQKPSTRKSKLEILDIQNEMLLGVAELLRNETARGILHSVKLPEKTEYDNMLPVSTREGM
jgi:hypothetical protein